MIQNRTRLSGMLIATSILGTAMLTTGFASPASAQEVEGPEVSWRLSAWGNPRAFTSAAQGISDYVSEQTGGNFTIDIAYGEALSGSRENLDGISLGAFEMAIFCVSYHPEKTPALTVLDLPLIPYANWDAQEATFNAIYSHPAIREELARWNALPIAASLAPNYTFFGRGDAPETLADWEGMRVRALGGMGDAMRTIGAVPTTVPAPETYTSLERGTIDAAAFGLGTHVAFGTHEISDWYTANLTIGTVNCPIVANIDAFNELPEQYQTLLSEAARDAGHDTIIAAWEADDEESLPQVEAAGMQAIEYSAEELAAFEAQAGQPVWDAWIDEMAAQGIPAQELFDLAFSTARGE